MAHRTCSEPDCESTDYYAVGLCRSHYDRQRRLRRLPPMPVRYLPDENGCWIWRWYVHSSGYGMVRVEGRARYAHRVVYEQLRGPVPDGLELDHLCRVRRCVNPEHLEPVTRSENLRRSPVTFAGRNARKTHCIRGHEFTPENTLVTRNGRNCIRCARLRSLARSRGGSVSPTTEEQAFSFAVEQRARELSGKEHGVIRAQFWRAAIVEFATMGEREEAA